MLNEPWYNNLGQEMEYYLVPPLCLVFYHNLLLNQRKALFLMFTFSFLFFRVTTDGLLNFMQTLCKWNYALYGSSVNFFLLFLFFAEIHRYSAMLLYVFIAAECSIKWILYNLFFHCIVSGHLDCFHFYSCK